MKPTTCPCGLTPTVIDVRLHGTPDPVAWCHNCAPALPARGRQRKAAPLPIDLWPS